MDRGILQRMCAYVGQRDLHHAEMTVKETIEFARRMLNAGNTSGDPNYIIHMINHKDKLII